MFETPNRWLHTQILTFYIRLQVNEVPEDVLCILLGNCASTLENLTIHAEEDINGV